jgi:hypothetical protein
MVHVWSLVLPAWAEVLPVPAAVLQANITGGNAASRRGHQ